FFCFAPASSLIIPTIQKYRCFNWVNSPVTIVAYGLRNSSATIVGNYSS
ncbi:3951_t:CDS:2, partial [Gigaspora rosea]